MKRSEIRKLASGGNRMALTEYIRENKINANKRIRNITKTFGSGTMRSNALNVALDKLAEINLSHFGGNLAKMTLGELEMQALTLNTFLESSTSTIRGVRKREHAMIEYLGKTGRMPHVENLDKFYEILHSAIAEEYYKIDSDEVLKAAANWANTPDFDSSILDTAWEKYESGQIRYIDEAWERIS